MVVEEVVVEQRATNSWPILHCTDMILVEDHEVVEERWHHAGPISQAFPIYCTDVIMVDVVKEEGIHPLVDLVPPPFCTGSP